MIYSTFAQVYDTLMDDSLYGRWADYVMKRVTPHHQKLLELAGGSGSLAVLLQKAGYDVALFDLSSEMLALAEQKLVDADLQMPLMQGDMRDLEGLAPVDVVTCFDDSLCYMQDLAQVKVVFQQVYNLLTPGGNFMFDAHSLHQMDDLFPGYMYNYQTEDYAFMWQSYAGDVPHSVEHDLTFFVYDEAIDAYHPLIETHHERTYAQADFVAALEQVGFVDVEVTADFGEAAVTPDAVRWFFSAKKPV
ncbi:class I SAM-dependent DNA methyltransferase [Lacticaseibacillus jixiensis]|uniref:class I SAM-dependent DNA methyltransferase n=1 Tax=Lacticaseibacillus jixiensis TaxID=3231926 RepID=UPI0036F44724